MKMKSMIPLVPDEHVANTCRPGEGFKTCRYLMMRCTEPRGWGCGKADGTFKSILDDRVAQNSIVAQGDNCPGWVSDTPPEDET
jgi:hypothetical protein